MSRAERDQEPSLLRRSYGSHRLEAFSDGVFAIAITLLVLELGVPDGSQDDLLGAIAAQWPSFLAYVVSFATIGAVWLTRVLQAQLFGIAATDPLTFGAVAAGLLAVATIATLVPALRATRVSPVQALRYE